MARLMLRLSFSGIRRQKAQGALSIVVVAVSTAALTIAATVSRVADRPFDWTFEATTGAHVTAASLPGDPSLENLPGLAGVVASTGVRGVAYSGLELDGKRYGLRLTEARATRDAETVSKSVILDGSWPRDGEVLLEQSFARFHDLEPGSTLTTKRTRLVVSGIAAVAAGEAYPRSQPGLAFATRSTLLRVVPNVDEWGQIVGLRVADPGAADVLAETVLSSALVGGRVVAQTREIGVLKATGFTPVQVSRLLVTEQLALAAVGVIVGISAGTLLTPAYVSKSAALLNAPEAPSLNAGSSLAVALAVLALVAVFSGVPGWRAARRTTAETVSGRLSGRRSSRLGGLVRPRGCTRPGLGGSARIVCPSGSCPADGAQPRSHRRLGGRHARDGGIARRRLQSRRRPSRAGR